MKKVVKKFKNKKAICFLDFVDVYSSHVIYYYGPPELCVSTLKKALAKCKKKVQNTIIDDMQRYIGSVDNTSDYFCEVYDIDGSQWILIHVGNKYDLTDIYQLGSIMHETLYGAIFITRSRGVKDDNGGYEALVYLAELMFTNFLLYIQKYYKKGQKNDKSNKIRSSKGQRNNKRNQQNN